MEVKSTGSGTRKPVRKIAVQQLFQFQNVVPVSSRQFDAQGGVKRRRRNTVETSVRCLYPIMRPLTARLPEAWIERLAASIVLGQPMQPGYPWQPGNIAWFENRIKIVVHLKKAKYLG